MICCSAAAPGVLANDIDPDVNGSAPDDTLRVIPFANGTTAAGALANMNTDGSFSYDPQNIFDWLRENETTNDTFGLHGDGSQFRDRE